MNILEIIIASILGLWLGSNEWRLRNMNNELKRTLDKDDIRDLIDLKQEVLRSEQQDIKEDLRRLEAKIDKLIDLQLK